jgi:release factor glutamine methyltransferase
MRIFSPYELAQLRKHAISPESVADSTAPVEYLTGWVEFAGLEIAVSPDVLIPRVESEWLVEQAGEFLKELPPNSSVSILDVGTGSGALGLAVAQRAMRLGLQLQTVLADISPAALTVAGSNARRLEIPVTLIESNFWSAIPPQQFDLILANLPYVPHERITTLDESVRDHEPHLALDGGTDGADLIRRCLSQLKEFLAPDGRALWEIDHTHTLETFADDSAGLAVTLEKDYQDLTRYLTVRHA